MLIILIIFLIYLQKVRERTEEEPAKKLRVKNTDSTECKEKANAPKKD